MELSTNVRTEQGLTARKNEIAQYGKDIQQINGRLRSLSVWGAFVYSFASFAIALFSSGYGFLVFSSAISSFLPSATGEFYAAISVLFSGLGIAFLANTLFRINQAALSPETLGSFRVSFENGSTVDKFPLSQPRVVNIMIHNFGKEMAEDVMLMVYFPKEFTVQPSIGFHSRGSSRLILLRTTRGTRASQLSLTTCMKIQSTFYPSL